MPMWPLSPLSSPWSGEGEDESETVVGDVGAAVREIAGRWQSGSSET